MYLDKPMRDHTLLQAIARVNRPYEDDEGKKKPFGFVLDFIGIFDKLEKALAFDSDEVQSVIKDITLLKTLFKNKMEKESPKYIGLIQPPYNDKEVDKLIVHFKDKSKRKEFFKFYNELEMLYEIISPDVFLRPFIDDYKSLTQIFYIVRNAYAKRIYVDKEFQRKTVQLVKENVGLENLYGSSDIYELNDKTIEVIKKSQKPDNVKIINLIKSIQKEASEHSGDLVLISLKEKAQSIQENYEDRIVTTEEALQKLEDLLKSHSENENKKKEKGFDSLTYFISSMLSENNLTKPEETAKEMSASFSQHPEWYKFEKETRELREELYFILLSKMGDMDSAYKLIDDLFNILIKANENLEK